MQTVKEILIAAKAKIANPENWTTGFLARDIDGNESDVGSPESVCFCSIGSIVDVVGISRVYYDVLGALRKFTGSDIAMFNDTHTHQEVLAAFDKAIAAAE